MDEDVRYGVTDDYFDAVAVADGIAVRMSENVAAVCAAMLDQLVRLLDDDQVEPRGGLRRGRSPKAVLRAMFPDAYRDRAQARAFRERHAAVLRDTAAVRGVRDRCRSGTTHVIDRSEVDDWVVALGLSQFLYLRRDARRLTDVGVWTNHMRTALLVAVNPELLTL